MKDIVIKVICKGPFFLKLLPTGETQICLVPLASTKNQNVLLEKKCLNESIKTNINLCGQDLEEASLDLMKTRHKANFFYIWFS